MNKLKTLVALSIGLAVVALSSRSNAGAIEISGSGTFNSVAPNLQEEAPDATWSFSFSTPDPFTIDPSPVSDVTYLLNGQAISVALVSISYYDQAFNGLFNLNFSDGTSVTFIGASLIDGGPNLLEGTFHAYVGGYCGGGCPGADGSGTITVFEPGSLTLMLSGLVGMVVVGRSRVRMAAY